MEVLTVNEGKVFRDILHGKGKQAKLRTLLLVCRQSVNKLNHFEGLFARQVVDTYTTLLKTFLNFKLFSDGMSKNEFIYFSTYAFQNSNFTFKLPLK